jgi:hypothetical protein
VSASERESPKVFLANDDNKGKCTLGELWEEQVANHAFCNAERNGRFGKCSVNDWGIERFLGIGYA